MLNAGYGPQLVVRDLNIAVSAGEIVALLGPNGAGKTTTLLALSGDLPLKGGVVYLDGQPTKAPLHKRAKLGMGFVTEEKSVIMGLSLLDNLKIACDPLEALAIFPELKARLHIRGGNLSGGEQQMLTLARALSRRPRVLLIDELSLGLAPIVVERLLEAVRDAARAGCGVILVEQHIRQALRVADRAYVMRRGRVELSGTADEMASRLDEIEETYLTGGVEKGPVPPAPDVVGRNGTPTK
jgi:branched-chain amino acid transport system ATP-binding protein